jgi:purine-binding chemotaxis protein CheW
MESLTTDMKVIAFRIGNEEFGLHIEQVFSIEQMQEVISIPNMPEHIVGVINLRGVITPIVDLRKVLSKKDVEDKITTRIIAVKIDDKPIGLIVDEATEVLDIPPGCIQKPNLVGNKNTSFLQGVAKLSGHLLVLIDIEKLLHNVTDLDDLEAIREAL